MYLQNRDLYYEVVISKAQGKLTKNCEKMMEMLATKTIKKKKYYSVFDKEDCYQQGLECMLAGWYNFNENIFDNAFSYFTEVFKRGTAQSFNQLYRKKGDNNHEIKVFSFDSTNDGQGFHSI